MGKPHSEESNRWATPSSIQRGSKAACILLIYKKLSWILRMVEAAKLAVRMPDKYHNVVFVFLQEGQRRTASDHRAPGGKEGKYMVRS